MDQTLRSVGRKIRNIFAVYGAIFFYTLVFVLLTGFGQPAGERLRLPIFSVSPEFLASFDSLKAYLQGDGAEALMLVLFAPFVEEAIFRLLPIAVISALAVANRRDAICAVVIVVCGIVFGLGHGHPVNVLLQGVGGVGLGLLFLANRPSNIAAYFSCVLAHSMLNFSIMMLQ